MIRIKRQDENQPWCYSGLYWCRRSCRCPAGNKLWLKAKYARIGHHLFMQFQANEKDCAACGLRKRCLRNEQQRTPRQVNVALAITKEQKAGVIEQMKHKIDSLRGRHIYSWRLGTVEPVFGHITDAIGIRRFSLRGKRKVDGQWKLMMMLHNISDDVFAVLWALVLLATAVWSWKRNRRWVLNTVATFGGIHFYTQWFEYLGASPGTVLVAGLLALGFAVGLRSVNSKMKENA